MLKEIKEELKKVKTKEDLKLVLEKLEKIRNRIGMCLSKQEIEIFDLYNTVKIEYCLWGE